MNLISTVKARPLSPEIEKLHDILCDCGVHRLWNSPKLHVLKYYLQNCETYENIRECLGKGIFTYLVKQAELKKSHPQEIDTVDDVLVWLLKNSDGHDLKQALRKTALQMNSNTVLRADFDPSHPSFARDHAEFEKLVTLMVIEGFPADFGLIREEAVKRLTCYELLQHRHGDAPVLRKMRKSIIQSEARMFAAEMAYHLGNKGAKPEGKTTCAKKFLELSYWDRLRLMRHYRFVVSETE